MDYSKHLAKAEEAERRRNYDFSIELYRQLLDLDPDLAEARAGLRRALAKRLESKGGGRWLRAIGGAVPLGKAKALAKAGRHDAAAKALEDYLKGQPLDPAANLMLGQCLEAAGHLASARVVYEYVAEIDPKNPEGLKRAGAMLAAGGEPAGAIGFYERALAIDPRDQEALRARKDLAAETALGQAGLEDASHSREKMVGAEAQAQRERAKRLMHTPEELEAERVRLEGRFTEDPSDVDVQLELARVQEKLGDLEAALDLVERAHSYRQSDYDLTCRLGDLGAKVRRRRIVLASKNGDEAEADRLERELSDFEIADHERRIGLRPSEFGLRVELARRLLRADRPDDALAQLQQPGGDPRQALEAGLLKARAFEAKRFPDLATSEFERVLAALPQADGRRKEILYTLGELALAENDRDRARAHFAAVFEIDITYRDVSRRMEELRDPPA